MAFCAVFQRIYGFVDEGEKFLCQRKHGFKESSARAGGAGGEAVERPLHKKLFHEATSIRALMSEQWTQTLQPCKPQLVVAISLPKALIRRRDAAGYKPRAVLPDKVRKPRPVSERERSDPTPH